MYYISVYDTRDNHIGWLDAKGELTNDKRQRAGFSSKQTADDTRWSLETINPEWYTELES